MYTLTRTPTKFENECFIKIYEFEFVEILSTGLHYKFRKTRQSKVELSNFNLSYDIIVRDTHELDQLYRNPEYACEYIDNESIGLKFMYFECQLSEEKCELIEVSTLHSNFNEYCRLRERFYGLVGDKIILTDLAHESTAFAFENEKLPIYKGYCFTNDETNLSDHVVDIIKQSRNFTYYEFKEDDE